MINLGTRTIKVNKSHLITQIETNKANHIKEYNQAVIDYKEEALIQLKDLTKRVKAGETSIKLELITPVNNAENYDKIIEMFRWELKEEVELSQDEFREYVQDEAPFAVRARSLNNMYSKISLGK